MILASMIVAGMIEKVERYETHILAHIMDGEYKGMIALVPTTRGMYGEYTFDPNGDKVHVLPLNGWRGRNLAEGLFGERDSGLLKLGTAALIMAATLKDLPQWDEVNTRYLAQYTGVVAIEVVAVSSGYGHYITVAQMNDPSSEDARMKIQLGKLMLDTARLTVTREVSWHERTI